jgi:hypothetical protein
MKVTKASAPIMDYRRYHKIIADFPYHIPGAGYLALRFAIAEIAFPLWLLIMGVNAEQ